jgi:endonuclease-3
MNIIFDVLKIFKDTKQNFPLPGAEILIQECGRDPFLVLIFCILSLRTKDPVSLAASRRLFAHVRTPLEFISLPEKTIVSLIYPVGFYNRKAAQIKKIAQIIQEKFNTHVPHGEDELLSLPGVGRKTMNLVRAEGFLLPALCVDTHVHRIANRLGVVNTKTPDETELALKKLLPQELWHLCNRLFFIWGQNICVPLSPFCSRCPAAELCPRVGVTRRR